MGGIYERFGVGFKIEDGPECVGHQYCVCRRGYGYRCECECGLRVRVRVRGAGASPLCGWCRVRAYGRFLILCG